MKFWLVKSEGDCYPISALQKDKKTPWTGVRNYQARNYMRDDMKVGDGVLFYHSKGTVEARTGVYGTARVASKPYPDPTQFDPEDEHYDPKSKKTNPNWILVDLAYVSTFENPVPLADLRVEPVLQGMPLLEKGSRLSVQPVSEKQFKKILQMGK
jgi:predicted RNA-binding protein with PUA-like domain